MSVYKYKDKTYTYYTDAIPCDKLCPGGNTCCCDNYIRTSTYTGLSRRKPSHIYHICEDPNCICHSKTRYEKPKVDPKYIEVSTLGFIRFVYYTGKIGFIPLKPKNLTYEEYHDLLRSRGQELIPDSVVPEIFDQMDMTTHDLLIELMEEEDE